MAAQLVVGVVALVVIAAAAVWNGRSNLEQAIEDRVGERAALVERFSAAGGTIYDPASVLAEVAEAGLVPGADDPANAAALERFRVGAGGDTHLSVMLVDGFGTVLASLPQGIEVDPEHLGDVLDDALDGRPAMSPVLRIDDHLVWARTFPVGAPTWGALVLVEDLEHGWLQELYEQLGALGRGNGGLTLVDRRGVAAASWNRELLGTRVVDPERFALPGTEPAVWTDASGGSPTIHIAAARTGPTGSALVFQQDEASFTGDLRETQRHRDATLLAILAGSVVALMWFAGARHRSIRRAERRAEVILAATDDLIVVVDAEGRMLSITAGLGRLLGHEEAAWVGRPLADLAHRDHRQSLDAVVRQAQVSGDAPALGVALLHADGTTRWFDVVGRDQRSDPSVAGVVVTCSEVGTRKALEDLLAHEASHDPLTGLANRARVEAELAERLTAGEDLVVAVVDLDRFKALNDQLGHDAGDGALVAVAAILASEVGEPGLAGRTGGDEFALLLCDLDDAGLDALAGRIIAAIEAISPPTAGEVRLSASIGSVRVCRRGAVAETVLREADHAMYRAKAAGGGRHTSTRLDPDPADASDPLPPVAPPVTPVTPVPGGDIPEIPLPSVTEVQRRRRLIPPADVFPLVVVLATIAVVVAVTVNLGNRSQEASERDRIEDRLALLESINVSGANTTDPGPMMELAAQVPWDLDNPGLTELHLSYWATASGVGDNGMAALLDHRGEVLAAWPPGVDVPRGFTGPTGRWDQVLDGHPHAPPLVVDGDGVLRSYWLLPIAEEGSVDRVLVLGVAMRDTTWSDTLVQIGSLGPSGGGPVVVDAAGRAIASWDPTMVGEVAIDPNHLARLDLGEAVEIRERVDGAEQLTLAMRMPGEAWDRFMLWQQPSADMFADLRQGQGPRDVAMLLIVCVTIAGLAWSNRRRVLLVRRQQGRLHSLLQESSSVVATVDRRLRFTFVSSGVRTHFGVGPRELVGSPIETLVGDAGPELRHAIGSSAPGHGTAVQGLAIPTPDGSLRVCDVEVSDLRANPAIRSHLIVCRDRTDRQALENHLRDQATHDPLTGLLNRSAFARRIETLHGDRREEVPGFAVVFIDLDHFKPVNDTHGHHVGDEVLRVLSRRLESVVRAGDVVARHGGDEFTVLLRNCDPARAEQTTERLLEVIAQPVAIGDLRIQVGASAGIALSSGEDGQVGHVLRTADDAMYRAKAEGRDRWQMAGPNTSG